jgi:tRNA nucleotidyltransferase (CCA-adding enzyme)
MLTIVLYKENVEAQMRTPMTDTHADARMRQLIRLVRPIMQPVLEAGWQWRVVGGAVRDLVLGRDVHDIDIEVVVPTIADLEQCFGSEAVGTDHRVVRLRHGDVHIDLSVAGAADVLVAAAGRDLTINAMALLPDGTLVDPYGGRADCAAGVLRHIGKAFADDPLRVLRTMRFAAVLGFSVAAETCLHAQEVQSRYTQIATARIWHEWHLWAQSTHLAQGLIVLAQTGWLVHYPMLAALVGCAQDAIHHPEGDVWVHTLYVCQGTVARRSGLHTEHVVWLSFAALCHDLGKPTTSFMQDGRIVCPGHAAAGVPYTEAFLTSIGAPLRMTAPVTALVREHMAAGSGPATPRSVRRLAKRLEPADIDMWARLVAADSSGRPPLPPNEPGAPFVAVAAELGVTAQPAPALLRGHDVLAAGVPAGPQIGLILAAAYEAQLDGVLQTHADALAWLLAYRTNTVRG